MSDTALEKIDPGALAALMTPEEIANFNADFSAGVTGNFLPQLSIRGNKFRLKIEGTEEVIGSELMVHLVGSRPCVSKTFYLGGYDPKSDQKAPDCSSVDGQYPDSNIQNPQAKNCQICDNNAWGSRGGESKGKACGDYKQVVVALAVAPEQAFGLRIPPTSFKALSGYIAKLKMAGVPANAATTKLTLVGDEYPVIAFEYAGIIDRTTFDKLKAVSEQVEVQQLIQIQPRAALPAAPAVEEVKTAVQPVVVETVVPPVVPVAEPAPTENTALKDLLAKNKTTKKRAGKKTAGEVVEQESTATAAETPETPKTLPTPETTSAPITNIEALLKKLKTA